MNDSPALSGKPKRVQMSRQRPWRQEHPDAVIVDRRTKWGNPFRVGEDIPRYARSYLVDPCDPNRARLLASLHSMSTVHILRTQQAVDAFAWWVIEVPSLMLSLHELRGRDLACWCPLDQPCHADVLLELANAEGD